MSSSNRPRRTLAEVAAGASAAPSSPRPPEAKSSDSVPVGTLRFSGIVRTTNGWAVARIDLTPEEWQTIRLKRIGKSQAYKEFIAGEHKREIMVLAQMD